MSKKLTKSQEMDLARRYTVNLERIIDLAGEYGVTRQAVYSALKRQGVDTGKNGGLSVVCTTCGEPFKKPRCQVRNRLHVFCSAACYYAFLDAATCEPYHAGGGCWGVWARGEVARHFTLHPGNVVHHQDRNGRNNELSNLRVFASQADHLRHHRGFDVTPLWDGRNR